jgi:hypothetical protein
MTETSPFPLHQRVYIPKKSSRHLGIVVDVDSANARVIVQWDNPESRASRTWRDVDKLCAANITRGASVVRGRLQSAVEITPSTPPFGVVVELLPLTDSEKSHTGRCLVQWDDSSLTEECVLDVIDIEWLEPVDLGDMSYSDWIHDFGSAHHLDFRSDHAGSYFFCARNFHIPGECQCYLDITDGVSHKVNAACMCTFRISKHERDGKLYFSGNHGHHFPGT